MSCPQQADRRPGGPAVPGDDGAEAAHRDRKEDRPVRIPGGHVDQGDRGGAEHDEHRVPLPPEQQTRAHQKERSGEEVQGEPVAVLGVGGEVGAEEHEGGQQQCGTPRPSRAAFLVVPAVPPGRPVPPPRWTAPRRGRGCVLLFHDRHARRPTTTAASAGRGDHSYSPRSTGRSPAGALRGVRRGALRGYGSEYSGECGAVETGPTTKAAHRRSRPAPDTRAPRRARAAPRHAGRTARGPPRPG